MASCAAATGTRAEEPFAFVSLRALLSREIPVAYDVILIFTLPHLTSPRSQLALYKVHSCFTLTYLFFHRQRHSSSGSLFKISRLPITVPTNTMSANSATSAAPLNVGQGEPSTSTVTANTAQGESTGQKKRRKKRKSKARRQSFAAPAESSNTQGLRSIAENGEAPDRPQLYRLGQSGRANLSDTSLASEALLDHREQPHMRPRRDSRLPFGIHDNTSSSFRPVSNPFLPDEAHGRRRYTRAHHSAVEDSDGEGNAVDSKTPLLGKKEQGHGYSSSYGLFKTSSGGNKHRSGSKASSVSSRRRRPTFSREPSGNGYDVNNPPSVPNSPKMGAEDGLDDVMVTDHFAAGSSSERRKSMPAPGDQLIDIDGDAHEDPFQGSTPTTPKLGEMRRHTMANPAEGDVCFPVEGMSEIGGDDYMGSEEQRGSRRRRGRQWPDLSVLEEWSREEKEERSEGIRAKKISEPVLVGGRLRPLKNTWHRAEEDAPYRFTYFNECFQSTIHSQTISELLQPGQTFRELFIPDPPELSDESSDDEDYTSQAPDRREFSPGSKVGTRHSSILGDPQPPPPRESNGAGGIGGAPKDTSGEATPINEPTQAQDRPKRYGSRPTFWLDVLSPTETEMRVIAKAFGIHPLTAEDIMMQEAREKVELFRNYYFVNYRTFEQDVNSEDYLEPVDMYVVVFRDGVLSFHFSQTPHPANVRRRIRQLKDYLILSADWISYAIIDDITDVFAPLIQSIEQEVDDIDDAILQMHTVDENEKSTDDATNEKHSDSGEKTQESGGDMLRRVGVGRKKVMGLYRLLGNKADVIKGFAKRCNEQWEIAPRSEIGLYLGDIQDHILTMTGNLSHYET
jgi:magnesium transporter